MSAPRPGARPVRTGPLVSIVVPVLDEADQLPGLLEHLASLRGNLEVVVVDGGSRDDSVALARGHAPAPRVIESARGRAHQLNAGAGVAGGDVLCFLHADTRLPDDVWPLITEALADPDVAGGDFRLRFGDDDWFCRLLGAVRRVERRLGVYYGDSAIFCRRWVFDALDGYAVMPIMEDYDFVRRLERRFTTVCLPGPVVTSARRWKALGLARTVWSWLAIRGLYLAGVPPERLARRYPHAR